MIIRLLFLILLLPSLAIAGKAELIRDDWGVPHIIAKKEPPAFYALGQAMAEDRAQRMLGVLLWARGEASGVLGPAHLETDRLHRLWRHREMGEMAAADLPPAIFNNYAAFAQGFNDTIDREHPDLAAYGFKPGVADFVTLARAMIWSGYQAADARAECGVNGMRYNEDFMIVGDNTQSGQSNGWAVSSARTAANAPIHLSDPHVEVDSVAYYEYRMHAGDLHSAGFSMGPLLWQAHTRHVAWAMTTGAPDVIDCYAVETDPDNPGRYRFDGQWKSFERVEDTIKVAGREAQQVTFEYTRHNGVLSPVLDRRKGVAYVASTLSMHRDALMHQEIDGLNRARNISQARQALATVAMFPQNLTIADHEGGLYYLRAGTVPVRPDGYDWKAPVPGNDSSTAWQGRRALNELVHLINPVAGYLQNNNTAPDTMIAPSPLAFNQWPRDVFNDRPGRLTSRGFRARQVLSGNHKVSFNDALNLAMDEKWVTWDDWHAALKYALDTIALDKRPNSADFEILSQRLLEFDGYARQNSQAAAAFYIWRQGMGAVLGRAEHEPMRYWPWNADDFTPTFARAILAEIELAGARLRDAYGTVDITLGEIIRGGKTSPGLGVGGITIDDPSIPVCVSSLRPQCERTLRAFAVPDPLAVTPQRVIRGSQAMRLVQFSKPIRSMSLYAFGQSDDPESPHFNDQTPLFNERRMKPTYFEKDELKGHIESRRTIEMPESEKEEPPPEDEPAQLPVPKLPRDLPLHRVPSRR